MSLSQRYVRAFLRSTHTRTQTHTGTHAFTNKQIGNTHTHTSTPTHDPNETLIHKHTMETLLRHPQNSPHTLETHSHALGSSRKQTEGSRQDLLASVSTPPPPPSVCLSACLTATGLRSFLPHLLCAFLLFLGEQTL